jgi:hypothetical protein
MCLIDFIDVLFIYTFHLLCKKYTFQTMYRIAWAGPLVRVLPAGQLIALAWPFRWK